MEPTFGSIDGRRPDGDAADDRSALLPLADDDDVGELVDAADDDETDGEADDDDDDDDDGEKAATELVEADDDDDAAAVEEVVDAGEGEILSDGDGDGENDGDGDGVDGEGAMAEETDAEAGALGETGVGGKGFPEALGDDIGDGHEVEAEADEPALDGVGAMRRSANSGNREIQSPRVRAYSYPSVDRSESPPILPSTLN